MNKAKYIVKYLISLVTQPEQTWLYLSKGEVNESKPQYMQANYYLPLLGLMSLFIFCTTGSASEDGFSLEHGMKSMVPALVAYFVSPYIAMFILKEILPTQYFKVMKPDSDRLHLYVFYSTSYLMAVEMAASLIPSLSFIRLAAYYLIYITWTGAYTMVRVEEHRRWIFGFLSFAIIYASPSIVIWILQFMQR